MQNEIERREAWMINHMKEMCKTVLWSCIVFALGGLYAVYSFWYDPLLTACVLVMITIMSIMLGITYLQYRKLKSGHPQSSVKESDERWLNV